MRVTVIKESVIYQQNIYRVDDSFELDDDVAESLIKRGYVAADIETVADNATVEDEAVLEEDVITEREQLEQMERGDLVALAKQLGVKANGKNKEIIERILEFREQEELADDDEEADELPNTSMPE